MIHRLQPVLYNLVKWYYRKARKVRYDNIQLILYPTVFHPKIYQSTIIFLQYLKDQIISKSKVLEIGMGNGLISLYLAKNKQCDVYAYDINPNAVKGFIENVKLNGIKARQGISNVFNHIPNIIYDYIICNPPYYKKKAKHLSEYAFFAGENLEFFTTFFADLEKYCNEKTQVLIILDNSAPIEDIMSMAKLKNWNLIRVFSKQKFGKTHIIFSCQSDFDELNADKL